MYSIEDWQKVRKLSRWGEVIPTWIYIAVAIISGFAVFIDNDRSNIWVIALVLCVGKWGMRVGFEEGYVRGWSEGQDYVVEEYTIDELLEPIQRSKYRPTGSSQARDEEVNLRQKKANKNGLERGNEHEIVDDANIIYEQMREEKNQEILRRKKI